jgi:ABC-type transport system involved in multi-copper enzyme maturation permease subunit
MLLFRYELKKTAGKTRLFLLGCFLLNIMGADSISRGFDRGVETRELFGRYLPNITLECAVVTLLVTHLLTGFEHASRTESVVYSTATGRKILLYKLAAAVCSSFLCSILLFGASLAAYFAKNGINTDWPLLAKVLPLIFALLTLFALIAFAAGTVIRNPWAAAITSFGVNAAWLGVMMNFPEKSLLHLPPMGLLISQKSWFTGVHGRHFELLGFALSGMSLIAICFAAYRLFGRREI